MLNSLLIIFGKTFSLLCKLFNLGNGSTWPGHIALGINKNFIKETLSRSNLKIIIITGTNGKTTTTKLIKTVLEENRKKVFQNQSGANLKNGIASSLILYANFTGKLDSDYAIFEIDENVLPQILKEMTPDYLILLNLFRDQLDRYGEVDTLARKWNESLATLTKKTKLILNADDPQIAFLGEKKEEVIYFGLNKKENKQTELEHAADSIYCLSCGNKLSYDVIYYSHLGIWYCSKCGLKRPESNLFSTFSFYPLKGTYNTYNTLAAVAVLKQIRLSDSDIIHGLQNFKPAFGRQEKINFKNKQVEIFLAKNPTGFNESLKTIKQLNAKTVLLVLNDNIADGRDISWIWDIDFPRFDTLLIAGSRAYDMGLRIKYQSLSQNLNLKVYTTLKQAILDGIEQIKKNECLYILPTYTAMLEVRKILTGKSIL